MGDIFVYPVTALLFTCRRFEDLSSVVPPFPTLHFVNFFSIFFIYFLNIFSGSRSGVTLSIAEKLNLTFTGIYDASAYDT